MTITSTSPLSVEPHLVKSPWWAGNFRLVNLSGQLQTVPRPAFVNTVPNVPETLKTTEGWSQFTVGFLIGGIGGAICSLFAVE